MGCQNFLNSLWSGKLSKAATILMLFMISRIQAATKRRMHKDVWTYVEAHKGALNIQEVELVNGPTDYPDLVELEIEDADASEVYELMKAFYKKKYEQKGHAAYTLVETAPQKALITRALYDWLCHEIYDPSMKIIPATKGRAGKQ